MGEKGLQGGAIGGNPQDELEHGEECLFAVARCKEREALEQQHHQLLKGGHE